MKRALLIFVALFTAAPTFAAGTQRYLVAMRHLPARVTFRQADDVLVPRNMDVYRNVDAFAADLSDEDVKELRGTAGVLAVEPLKARHLLDTTPSVPEELVNGRNPNGQTTPYGISLVNAQQVWPVARGEAINIVIIDTGIDYTHPDLKDDYAGGFNALKKNNDPKDDHGHGTHVAGTIGAEDNGLGVVGVAPKVRLWSAKVLGSDGNGNTAGIVAALDWVIGKKHELGGNWIISLSLGDDSFDPVEEQAFQRIADNGILAIAASGNDGGQDVSYPAGYSTVMAIGAVDSNSKIADFSNQGVNLSLVGPGVDVLSTLPIGTGAIGFVSDNGTAFSGAPLTGSTVGTVTGKFVDCGFGRDGEFPSSVSGKIAVISRGNGTFHDKTQRAKAAGAIAVVIYNNDDNTGLNFTLGNPLPDDAVWPTTIAITNADGLALLQHKNDTITVTHAPDDYGLLSGTSMATPHASGVAALVWSVAPQVTAQQLRQALEQNAHDLGDAGRDSTFGFGLVDALATAKALAPALFSTGSTPGAPVPTNGGFTGRRILRH